MGTTAKTRKAGTNERNGASGNQFGVPLGDIRKLAKKIKINHELGLELWATGNIDARLLAVLLIKPKQLSASELNKLVKSATFPHSRRPATRQRKPPRAVFSS